MVFERIGVREMGRKSFSASLITFFFGIGITSASFHRSGTKVSQIDELKISATGEEISKAKSFKIQLGILSGPDAFPFFRLESSL